MSMMQHEILNLTQHEATVEQVMQGVIEPTPEDKEWIKKLLTFDEIPDVTEIKRRCNRLMHIVYHYGINIIMIGGAGWIISTLEKMLTNELFIPVHSFSIRDSVETTLPDGTVKKTTSFKHIGFVHTR